MKIIVLIKRVEDPQSSLKINSDGVSLQDAGKYVINPFDEIALEEALRLRDKHGGEVVAMSCGSAKASTELRTALAMGADRATHIVAEQPLDPWLAATALAAAAAPEKSEMIIMGKQAIDDDAGQTGLFMAELLGWPHASFVSKEESLESAAEKAKSPAVKYLKEHCEVLREVDGGMETLKISLPAVITCELRLNIPRYASLPGIMKAKKKEIETLQFASLVGSAKPRCHIRKFETPTVRKAGSKVADVATLVKQLQSAHLL